MAVGIGKTDLAVVGGILRSVEDIVRGVTSSGLGERLGGCSSCEFPCVPTNKSKKITKKDHFIKIIEIMIDDDDGNLIKMRLFSRLLVLILFTLRLPLVVKALPQVLHLKGLSPV